MLVIENLLYFVTHSRQIAGSESVTDATVYSQEISKELPGIFSLYRIRKSYRKNDFLFLFSIIV